jgi:predicted transcriptional regulator
MIFCSEKEAAVCLYSHSGRLDYGGFFGGDPAFVAWTTDLFLYYWDRASHCMP